MSDVDFLDGEDTTASDQWMVKTNPTDGSRPRTLFVGREEDARAFIARSFPRPHVEPGIGNEPNYDALLHSPEGDAQTHHSENGFADYEEE